MDHFSLSETRLLEENRRLRSEVASLRTKEAAFEAQKRLLEDLVNMARSPGREEMLAALIQRTLDVAAELVGAETGSLFLIDKQGNVTDSILVRGDATLEEKGRVMSTVLDKGLAGWVRRHRKIGPDTNTKEDTRWLSFPNQP